MKFAVTTALNSLYDADVGDMFEVFIGHIIIVNACAKESMCKLKFRLKFCDII